MDAEIIIPSEVKSERQNKCDVTYTWNPKKKKDTNEFIYKTEIESQTKNTNL